LLLEAVLNFLAGREGGREGGKEGGKEGGRTLVVVKQRCSREMNSKRSLSMTNTWWREGGREGGREGLAMAMVV